MKTVLIIAAIIIAAMAVIVGIFKLGGVCPRYLNAMPGPLSPGETAARTLQSFLCPFSQKVY